MRDMHLTRGRLTGLTALVWLAASLTLLSSARSEDPAPQADAPLTEALAQAIQPLLAGDVGSAEKALAQLPEEAAADPRVAEVKGWMEQFGKLAKSREELRTQERDRAFAKAKSAMDKGEFREAIRFALLVDRLTEPEGSLAQEGWVRDLTTRAELDAERLRGEEKWLDAASTYGQLAYLHRKDDGLRKRLEDEARKLGKHTRVSELYKKESRDWPVLVDGVSPGMVRPILQHVDHSYVSTPDIRKMAEHALDAMTVLATTSSIRETFPGLADDAHRAAFAQAIDTRRERLANAKGASDYDWRDLAEDFTELAKVNADTVQVPETVLTYEFVEAALAALDPFTATIWPSEVTEFRQSTTGKLLGVGVQIQMDGNRLTVVTPLDGSPAYLAGIHKDDVIVKVLDHATGQEHDLTSITLPQAVKLIKGPEGTEVTLFLERPGVPGQIQMRMARAEIKLESVKGLRRDEDNHWDFWLDRPAGVAYVQVPSFAEETVSDLSATLSALSEQGMKGVILDLRGNPGGLLNAAEDMADLFLKTGTVVSTKGRAGRSSFEHKAKPGQPFEDLPVIVLVDENSASASEIVSGAVQDLKRGLVIGQRTFGKGSVQNLLPIRTDNAFVKLTTAKYYLPNGRSLHRDPDSKAWGVEPDVKLDLSPEEYRQVETRKRDRDILVRHADATKLSARRPLSPSTQPSREGEDDVDAAPASQPAEPPLPTLDGDPQLELALLIMRVKLLAQMEWPFAQLRASGPGKAG